MRVLLTGASGFVGSYLLEAMVNSGIETITVGRHAPNASSKKTSHVHCDLLQEKDLPSLVKKTKVSHLLHCAWFAEHGAFWNSPINTRWVDASLRLVEAFCSHGGERVVGVGTCAEYDWSYKCCQEATTPLNASSLYGASKDATRRLTEMICKQHQVGFAWGRIFAPFGTGENAQRLIPSLIRSIRGEAQPMGINTDIYRDYLHVSDVARALTLLVTGEFQGAYNISSGQPVQLGHIARSLAQVLGMQLEPALLPRADFIDPVSLLFGDNTKIKKLGWTQLISLEAGLEMTARAARNNTRKNSIERH